MRSGNQSDAEGRAGALRRSLRLPGLRTSAVPIRDDAGMTPTEGDEPQLSAVGRVIRRQRQLAQLSLRQLSKMSNVSNAYLSQVERGLHEPSVRVLRALSEALSVPMEELMSVDADQDAAPRVEKTDAAPVVDLVAAIEAEPQLTPDQKQALLAVYRGFLQQNG